MIKSAVAGKIRKYKVHLSPESVANLLRDPNSELEFEITRDFKSPTSLADDMFRALQDGKYLIPETS